MKLTVFVCGVLLTAGLMVSHPAYANDGEVSVGGQVLFTIKSPAAGESIAARVDAVTERLRPILSDAYLNPRDIHLVRQPDRSVKLMVKDRLLVTVTPDDGRVNQLSAWDQARIWQAEVRRTLPQVSVKPLTGTR